MAALAMPPLSPNFAGGWGPPPHEKGEHGLQHLNICDFVEHLDKFPLQKIGKVCDFTASGQRWLLERSKKGKGKGKNLPIIPKKDDEGFVLKDSKPLPTKSAGRGRGQAGRTKGRGKGLAVNYQEGILGKKQGVLHQTNPQKGKGKGRPNQRRGVPSFKEWSVQTKTEWELKQEILLNSLSKLQLDARDVKCEDVKWCGRLGVYDKVFDRLTTKTERRLPRFEGLVFYELSTSTTDDENLEALIANDPEVSVIATGDNLAVLVAAARSVYSWDLIVTKYKGKIIFDKRNHSQVDYLSVNETAEMPPNNDDKDHINAPVMLSHEATCINQNFSQMVLDARAQEVALDEPNPFDPQDGETQVAAVAYRYRKITLPGNPKATNEFERNPITMAVRTEVNGKMPDADMDKGLVSVKALNEYEPKPTYNWRAHLDSQRGMCLATEVKNNAYKLGRWTAQAMLAGCDTLKLGYVSRTKPTDRSDHTLLGVQTHMTNSMAEQIGVNRNNMFGILRTIIDLVMSWDDGKYLILKDPTKSVLRLYEVPWDSFQDDEEESESEQEEEIQELDEDGNVAPSQPQGLR